VGDLANLRNALKSAMQIAMPTRIVTRDFKDFADREQADLEAGVVSIIGNGEKDYAPILSRAAELGTVPFVVVGQVKLAEDAAPSAVEDAEDLLAEELKAFCRAPGDDLLGGISFLGFRQSGQMDAPYGWIAADIEVMT
jgi:hypothetical protein